MILQVPADSTDRLVPSEIAHDRNQKIVTLELAQRAEVRLVGQVAVIQPGSIRRQEQLGVGRKPSGRLLSGE